MGPEFALPAAPSAIASDGTHYVAVWACGTAICGTLITAAGTFGPVKQILTRAETPSQVRIASDGNQYLIAWSEPGSIYAARIGADATSLGTPAAIPNSAVASWCWWYSETGERIYLQGGASSGAELIFDGTNYVVAWRDSYPNGCGYWGISDLASTYIPTEGSITPSGGGRFFAADTFGPSGTYIGITAATATFGVTSIEGYPDNTGAFVDFHGGMWLTLGHSARSEGNIAPSSSGSSQLVAFRLYDPYFTVPAAMVLTQRAFVAAIRTPTGTVWRHLSDAGETLIAGYDGTNHLVLWTDSESTLARRITPSGAFFDSEPLSMPDLRGASALVSNERGTLLLQRSGNARFLVTDVDAAVEDVLAVAADLDQAIATSDFKNANQQAALANMLKNARQLMDQALYGDALTQLADALNKTDGCAAGTAPDANDWIRACTAQADLYKALSWAMELIETKPLTQSLTSVASTP